MLKIAWDHCYNHPLPTNHRFPMEKYELVPDQLMHEGIITKSNLFAPENPDIADILAVHDWDYVDKLRRLELTKSEIRRIGFPLSKELVSRELIITQGTIACATYAMEHGISMNVAGGTHHAYATKGEGYCLLNDQAIAARHVQQSYDIERVMIIDLDVHQGNGTAAIFQDDPSVYTFSIHGGRNYPFRKEISDCDVPLDDGTGDEEYLERLALNLGRAWSHFDPDFVFYQSGVDVLGTDKLGRLALTLDGCKERDAYVMRTCKDHGVPIVACMGGGYSPLIADVVNAHVNTFKTAAELYF